MGWFLLIVWGLIGVVNLFSARVTKYDYALMWIMLMYQLIKSVL